MPDRRSPLDAAHRALGAKMVPFSGWEMPLSYPTGTLAEHRTCRTGAVAFDVSHLGTVRLHGAGAYDLIQRTLTNDLGKVGPGRAQYTHLLDDDGSVLDDIIVWWIAAHEFHVMPNAANTERVRAAIGGDDITHTRAVVAVQGPESPRWLADVFPEAAKVPRFRVAEVRWKGAACIVAGTGYTGEDGVEIAVPAGAARDLWEALLDVGILPAGLGARDTLRLEAGLDWVVAWGKGDFRGREALEAERKRGLERILRGLEVEGRQPPRAGYQVMLDGAAVGQVTSGNFSPTLGRGIALAFLPPPLKAGAAVSVDARGQRMPARVVYPPFVTRRRT
ncbi:MAG: glycine cleavage system aminomethyltransferase GcvT [Actinomycetota bacterium]|nr:glycine cleavage system aminomethyltransferase GcvT [Actinomycetota bacterium]